MGGVVRSDGRNVERMGDMDTCMMPTGTGMTLCKRRARVRYIRNVGGNINRPDMVAAYCLQHANAGGWRAVCLRPRPWEYDYRTLDGSRLYGPRMYS